MKQEELSRIIGSIDDHLVVETSRYDSTLIGRSPERTHTIKMKRIITFALAAALVLALGIGAYAAGLFGGKPEVTTTPIDHDDPLWEEVLNDAPYANVMQHIGWESHNNLPTAEIEALLAEMEGKEEFSHRDFTSVNEMEKAYGIELLKLGKDECHVQGSLAFWNGENASSGALADGSWNSYEDSVYLFTYFSYYFNSPYINSLMGGSFTVVGEVREYEIRSLGVTAQIVSSLIEGDGRSEREIAAYFSYGGIDYCFIAILDPALTAKDKLNITADWLCEKLETLQKPSWVSETAGPVPERPSDDAGEGDDIYNGKDGAASFDENRLGVWWAPHNNLPTAEIEALLAEMEGKKEYSDRSFSSVSEMENTYGIELLKLGKDECHIQGSLVFWNEEDHSAGAGLHGWWNSYEDGVYLSSGFSYFFNNPENHSSMGIDLTARDEPREYEIRSLGVIAQIVSGKDANNRVIIALFSYGGIDYHIEAILDPDISTKEDLESFTADWLCEKLETLQKPSWMSGTASPADENDSKVTVFFGDDFPGRFVFDAEEAGPSGVILTKAAIDQDDPDWENLLKQIPHYANANESLSALWAPHGNLPTTEMEQILKNLDKDDPHSSQSFDSVREMAKFYGVQLLQSDEKESDVYGSVTSYAYADFTGIWIFRAEGVCIDTMAIYVMDPEYYSCLGTFWASIDEETEYQIRSLGVTARLVSGLNGAEGTDLCVTAFFSCDGIDYFIRATADEGQDISIDWLCTLLETLHK